MHCRRLVSLLKTLCLLPLVADCVLWLVGTSLANTMLHDPSCAVTVGRTDLISWAALVELHPTLLHPPLKQSLEFLPSNGSGAPALSASALHGCRGSTLPGELTLMLMNTATRLRLHGAKGEQSSVALSFQRPPRVTSTRRLSPATQHSC